jgi:hypothetical protein
MGIGGQTAGQLIFWDASGAVAVAVLRRPQSLGGALFLIITAGVFPLAREGFFASGSMFQGTLLIQAALFAAVWAVAWSTLTGDIGPAQQEMQETTGANGVSRRSALRSVAGTGLPRVSPSSAGGWRRHLPLVMLWRSARPRRKSRRALKRVDRPAELARPPASGGG